MIVNPQQPRRRDRPPLARSRSEAARRARRRRGRAHARPARRRTHRARRRCAPAPSWSIARAATAPRARSSRGSSARASAATPRSALLPLGTGGDLRAHARTSAGSSTPRSRASRAARRAAIDAGRASFVDARRPRAHHALRQHREPRHLGPRDAARERGAQDARRRASSFLLGTLRAIARWQRRARDAARRRRDRARGTAASSRRSRTAATSAAACTSRPHARIDDGLFDVVVFRGDGGKRTPAAPASAALQRHAISAPAERVAAARCRASRPSCARRRSGSRSTASRSARCPARFECLPGALRLRRHRRVSGICSRRSARAPPRCRARALRAHRRARRSRGSPRASPLDPPRAAGLGRRDASPRHAAFDARLRDHARRDQLRLRLVPEAAQARRPLGLLHGGDGPARIASTPRARGARANSPSSRPSIWRACSGQDVEDPAVVELLALFATALNDLGEFLERRHAGSFAALVEAAERQRRAAGARARGDAAVIATSSVYGDFEVPFYKRAQITVADLSLAFDGEGYGRFEDLAELTAFADNLVPHVLRMRRRAAVPAATRRAHRRRRAARPRLARGGGDPRRRRSRGRADRGRDPRARRHRDVAGDRLHALAPRPAARDEGAPAPPHALPVLLSRRDVGSQDETLDRRCVAGTRRGRVVARRHAAGARWVVAEEAEESGTRACLPERGAEEGPVLKHPRLTPWRLRRAGCGSGS